MPSPLPEVPAEYFARGRRFYAAPPADGTDICLQVIPPASAYK